MAVTFDEATKSYTDGVTTLELKNGAYEIGTVEQLKLFRDAVNEGNSFAKATVKLTADIDLENEEWTPIGTKANAFAGIFDGGGHTVSNLYINQPSRSDVGFFGYTRDGEIRNLTIENADVTGYLDVGAVAGTPYTSKYTNITLAGTVKVEGYSYVGGMLGKNAYADLTGLTVDVTAGSYVKAESQNYRSYVGGVVGFMGEGNITVKDVTSNINVSGSTCDVGGIAGIAHYGNTFINVTCTAQEVVLVNAQDEGDHLEVGGIAGVWHNKAGNTVQMINCKVENTELKSSLNGVEQDVSANTVTGKAYNAESETSGSLLVGQNVTIDDATGKYTGGEFTVSGPDAVDVLNGKLADGMQAYPDSDGSLIVDEAGYVAAIGDVRYKSLVEALAAAQAGGTLTLIGDQLLKTDFDDGGEWPKRNFDLALDGDLTLKAADGAESTLTLTVVDSQNSGGGSTNQVGELAFYSSSADQRATFTLEKGVTIDTNAKIWFGRPTQSSSSDTTPTDIVVNGNIIQQAHDGRYYGILQIQTEKDSTVLVNGSVAFGWTLSVRGAVFTVSSTGEVKASDPASTSSTILVDARSGVGGKFIVDGSKAVSAVVLDVDELGSFEMKNEAAAAFDTVDLAKNATLLVADGSTLTADAVTNAGTIQITGENGKLAVAEGGLTNKGAIVFGASDKTVNTTFDVGMLSKKAGSSAFNFQNGEVTLTGAMADGIRIQPFNVGRNSENVALDAASAIVNIAAGAVVNTHQTYIAENDGVNEHTLNVYGTLNAMTSIYNKQQGNLNIYGTVTANYMQGAGNVLVSGENAVLNLAGNGGNSLLMGRTGRTFRIADGGTVIAGGNVSVGYDEYSGVMEITGGGRLEAQTITVNNSSRLTLDHTASLSFGSITKAANATITVDLSGYTDQFALLIENTGSDATDYASLISNWNELEAAGCTVVGNDLFLGEVDMTVFKVDAGWNGSEFTEEVAPGYRYGINAFSGINQALGEAAVEPEKIVIAAGTYDESAAQFVKGVEIASESAVFSNVWSFGVNSDTGRDFDMETAEKFTVTGDLTVGQFYAEKNANVYVKIDGYLTTVGSFGAKLATQVDVNGTVTVTPEPSSQVMVYGTMNVTGTLDVTTGAMGAVLIVGRESYETEYGKGGVLNVSGADASVVLRNNTGSAIPVTVSALSSLTIADGATFINETGGLKNLGTVTVNNGTLTLSEAFENSGTLNFSNTTTDFGTVANADGGMVNFLGGNEISGTVLGGGDVNFNGILSFEEAAEGEPSVIAQKNGAAVTLKAGKDVLTGKVAAEDVNVGGMASGMVSGVEQLVLQGGSLALEDLTIHAGSSLTMDLNSSFAFSGTVAVNQAGVVVDGTTTYVYGAGSFTVDASAFTTGSYKLIDYTGTAVQDYSFVSNLGELENKLIFNNDLYITDKSAEILYVSNSYTGDAGDVMADGNILGYNAFATAKEAFSSANSSGGAMIDLQDEVYTYAAPQGTGVELTNAGTYTVINGKGVLLNYELEVNPDKADGEYLLNVEDAHLTLTKLTLRANATMTVTDSRIDYNAFEGGSAYLSVYTNSVLNVSGSTIGFDPRQSKGNDPADLPDAGTYWNWAPTWNIYGTANIEDSTLFAYVGQANQAGFDVRGNGTATITGSEVSLALLNVGTSYEENKLDPAADKSNLLATLTLDGTTVRNTQYRGDYTTQNGINVGQEDGTSAGKLVIRNGSDIDFTVLTYNDAREIGLSVRNDKSSVEISDSTFKAPSITNNGTITVSGSVLKADEVKNDGTILVSGTSVLNISALTGEIVLADGATLTDSSVGGTVSAEGNVSVAGKTSVDRLVLKGVRGENSELSIGADAVVAVKQLEVGTGLQKPDLVPGDTAAREYFSKAQIDGALTVDRANQAGAIYIRPYAELVVTGTLNVKGEVHNRGSLVVDGGTMNISDWETPKLLGYTTGDSLTVTNQGSMILTGVSTVTFGEAHAYKAEMGVEAQYADGMFATILAGGKFEADTLAFRNDDDVTLTVTGEGSSFKLYSASGRTVTGTYNYAVNEGAIIVAEKASFDVSGLANAEFVNSGSITLSSASAKFATLTNNGTFTVSGTSTLNIGSVNAASGDAHRIQIAAGTTLKDSVIGGDLRVLGDLTVDGELALGNGGIWCGYGSTQTTATISGGMITAKYAMFQYGTYVISADMTLDYGYLSYGGTFTVNSTIKASGQSGEPFYVRGDVTLADGGKLLIDKALWLDYEGAVLTVADGAAVEAGGLKLIADTSMNVNGGSVKVGNTLENNGTVTLGGTALTAGKMVNSGAIVMDSSSSITVAGTFTSTGTITARVDAAQSGVSFVQKLIGASAVTVNGELTLEGGRDGAQLVATGNALWLDNSDKSTILINSGYAGEVGSAIVDRDGYFFGFNALMEYSTSIGADSAVEFTGGSYRFEDGFSFTGREFTVSGDTSFNKVTGGSVAVTGGTLSIDTVVLTADVATLSGALLAFSGSGMADLENLVLTGLDTNRMANRTKYVLATGVKDDSFAVTLNGETYELNVRKDGLLVGVENGELYVQKTDDWFNKAGDSSLTVLPANGYAFGGSDMHESAVMSVERDLNVATNGQNAKARVYGGGLLRNDALFSGTQKCEVTVTAGGVGKGVIGGNRVESGSIGGTLTSSVTIDSADGTFGFIVGGNQLTGGELNGFGSTSVTIQNGTFSMWICGGSVAGGDAAAQVMGNTNVTITGGTFNGTGVFGGGFVQENGTLNQVGNTNVAISGGTFAGNIYGGHGATNKDASPNGVLFGNTNITISGGIFNGNIYGGGFDQSKVQGDTHITFTGTAGADFSVNGIIDGDASNARYWSKGSFVTGDRYLTFDAFTGEFGATLITNIDQMEVTGGSDVNLKNQLDLSEVSQWEFDFGSSLEGFAQNDLAGDTLVLSGWEDQLGDEGWTVMSGSSITGFGEMEVTNGSNLIFAWNADEQYYLGSIGDEQFKLSMEDGAMKLAKLA